MARSWNILSSFADPAQYVCSQNILQEEGFEDDARLDESIKKLESDLKRTRKKDVAEVDDQVSI